jgi:hypothetical protein
MYTARLTRPAARAALAAGTLTVLALHAAGTASAEAPDDQYLGILRQQGISFGTESGAIAAEHHVCDALGYGMEPSDISHRLAASNPGIDGHTGLVITVVAVQSYCPQFVHQMANGTTVVGPDH